MGPVKADEKGAGVELSTLFFNPRGWSLSNKDWWDGSNIVCTCICTVNLVYNSTLLEILGRSLKLCRRMLKGNMRIPTCNLQGSRSILQRTLRSLQRTSRTLPRSSRTLQWSSRTLHRSLRILQRSLRLLQRSLGILKRSLRILQGFVYFLQRSSRILVQDLVQDPKWCYGILNRMLSNMRILGILCNPTGSCRIL